MDDVPERRDWVDGRGHTGQSVTTGHRAVCILQLCMLL